MKYVLLAAAAALTLASPMPASAKTQAAARAITANDLVMMERVSDPRVSPDGKYVSYTLRTTDYAQNKCIKQVWLLPLKTKAARVFASGKTKTEIARWTPDSRAISLVSTLSGP